MPRWILHRADDELEVSLRVEGPHAGEVLAAFAQLGAEPDIRELIQAAMDSFHQARLLGQGPSASQSSSAAQQPRMHVGGVETRLDVDGPDAEAVMSYLVRLGVESSMRSFITAALDDFYEALLSGPAEAAPPASGMVARRWLTTMVRDAAAIRAALAADPRQGHAHLMRASLARCRPSCEASSRTARGGALALWTPAPPLRDEPSSSTAGLRALSSSGTSSCGDWAATSSDQPTRPAGAPAQDELLSLLSNTPRRWALPLAATWEGFRVKVEVEGPIMHPLWTALEAEMHQRSSSFSAMALGAVHTSRLAQRRPPPAAPLLDATPCSARPCSSSPPSGASSSSCSAVQKGGGARTTTPGRRGVGQRRRQLFSGRVWLCPGCSRRVLQRGSSRCHLWAGAPSSGRRGRASADAPPGADVSPEP